MIRTIKITDLSAIESIAKSGTIIKENVWISAVDKQDAPEVKQIQRYMEHRNIPYHVEYFYDFDDKDIETNAYGATTASDVPQKHHIENFINFIKPFVDSPESFYLGINCFAGISRSTALGIMVWTMQGLNPTKALYKILEVRPMAWPNLRILRLASEILQKDIYSPIKQWVEEEKEKPYFP